MHVVVRPHEILRRILLHNIINDDTTIGKASLSPLHSFPSQFLIPIPPLHRPLTFFTFFLNLQTLFFNISGPFFSSALLEAVKSPFASLALVNCLLNAGAVVLQKSNKIKITGIDVRSQHVLHLYFLNF